MRLKELEGYLQVLLDTCMNAASILAVLSDYARPCAGAGGLSESQAAARAIFNRPAYCSHHAAPGTPLTGICGKRVLHA